VPILTLPNLSANKFSTLLLNLRACESASIWAEGKDFYEVWNECQRGDWMIWLLARHGNVDRKILVAIACDCAEPALIFVTKGDERPAQCIETTRHFIKGEATLQELIIARAAADVADADAYADAYAAADAAAYAAAYAAADAAYAAKTNSLAVSADVCRKYISVSEVF
jgi:hypothetical protein